MQLDTDPDENASALQAKRDSCERSDGRGTSGAIVGVSSGARVDQQAKQQWNTMALVITDGRSEPGRLAIDPFSFVIKLAYPPPAG